MNKLTKKQMIIEITKHLKSGFVLYFLEKLNKDDLNCLHHHIVYDNTTGRRR